MLVLHHEVVYLFYLGFWESSVTKFVFVTAYAKSLQKNSYFLPQKGKLQEYFYLLWVK